MENIDSVFLSTLKLLKPPPRLSLSDWADRYAYLSVESSAEAGKWKTLPYQKEIMDAITDPNIEQVWLMKSARIGFTMCINHTIGYYIHQDPTTIMVVQPTIEDANGYSKENIAPMLDNTPVLRGVVADAKVKDGSNTLLMKTFAGGSLSMIGANSPRGFRRVSRRVILLDEIDSYPVSAGAEGDPVKLAMKRSEYYYNRKIVGGSTPTIQDHSRIERMFLETDQRRYFVPCPHCGHEQYLKWPQFKWDEGLPRLVWYECEKNKCRITHASKRWMIENGKFQSTAPSDNPKKVGFHIWAAYSYSPNSTWENLVEEFLDSKRDPETLKTFINTVLGEVWVEDYKSKIDANELLDRCEFYKEWVVPAKAVLLTAGVDVQDDRLEVSIYGWADGEESWLVTHQVIYGDPARIEIWKQLDELLFKPIKHESGATLTISATAIDSGGHHTSEVYRYTRERKARHVFAIKGQSQKGKPPLGKATKVDINFKNVAMKSGAEVYPMGSDTIKDTLWRRFRIKEGEGAIHFFIGLSPAFFDQLTSEKPVTRLVKGFPVREWTKRSHARNEAWDCLVMSYAALHYLYMRKNRRTMFNQYRENLEKQAKIEPKNVEVLENKGEIESNKPDLPKTKKGHILVPRRKGFLNSW